MNIVWNIFIVVSLHIGPFVLRIWETIILLTRYSIRSRPIGTVFHVQRGEVKISKSSLPLNFDFYLVLPHRRVRTIAKLLVGVGGDRTRATAPLGSGVAHYHPATGPLLLYLEITKYTTKFSLNCLAPLLYKPSCEWSVDKARAATPSAHYLDSLPPPPGRHLVKSTVMCTYL